MPVFQGSTTEVARGKLGDVLGVAGRVLGVLDFEAVAAARVKVEEPVAPALGVLDFEAAWVKVPVPEGVT